MPEIENMPKRGLNRRTVLQATAWSVPVVAIAVATPLAAASVGADLQLVAMNFGETLGARSPDGLQSVGIAIPGGYQVTTLGTEPTAAGATLVVSFDNRWLGALSVTIDGLTAPQLSIVPTGNKTTVTFAIPSAIPAEGAVSEILPRFDVMNRDVWAADVEPYTVTVIPPSGSTDPALGNNSVAIAPRYTDTTDAAVSVAWGARTVSRVGGGADFPIYVPETVTVTAVAPGDVVAGNRLAVWGPTTLISSDPTYVYTGVFTGVTVVSALLDGVDVTASLGPTEGDMQWNYGIPVNIAIPAGQSLVITLDVHVDTAPREWVYNDLSGGHVSYSNSPERTEADNRVEAPQV